MPAFHYQYKGLSYPATFEAYETPGGTRYLITLADGRQAVLEGADVSEDLSKVLWVQEKTPGHAHWPKDLVQAVGEGQEQFELEEYDKSFVVEFKDGKSYSAELVKLDGSAYQVVSSYPDFGPFLPFTVSVVFKDGHGSWILNNEVDGPAPGWLDKLGKAIEASGNL